MLHKQIWMIWTGTVEHCTKHLAATNQDLSDYTNYKQLPKAHYASIAKHLCIVPLKTSAPGPLGIYHLDPPLAGGGGSVRLNGAGASLDGTSLEGPSLGAPSLGGASLLGASRSSLAAAPKRRGGPSLGASLESCLAGALEPLQLDGASRAAAHNWKTL